MSRNAGESIQIDLYTYVQDIVNCSTAVYNSNEMLLMVQVSTISIPGGIINQSGGPGLVITVCVSVCEDLSDNQDSSAYESTMI